MKEFDLGNMSDAAAEKVEKALDGKTYMNFRVSKGRIPGPEMCVTLETDYDDTDVELLTMALHVMATS